MITLTLEDRSLPLLGQIEPILPNGPDTRPEDIRAHLNPTHLGQEIIWHWKDFHQYVPEIRPLFLQLMEEHLHGILQVRKRMLHPLGNAVGGFKTWCNNYYRQITGNPNVRLFSAGFHDSIVFGKGQLPRIYNYLRDNPRRLAIKRLFPEFFTKPREITFGGNSFIGFGNSFLLDGISFHQIQASRSITSMELVAKRDAMFQAINRGTIIISPCISPGERLLAREALEAEASLIVLQHNGFRQMYKPPGVYFDACASGRLLLLVPKEWGYTTGKCLLTREKALALNALASQIAAQGNYD